MIMSTMLASVAEGMCLSDTLGLSNEALIEVGWVHGATRVLSVLATGTAIADIVVAGTFCIHSHLLFSQRPGDHV